MVKLRAIWIGVNSSYWFWPAVLSLAAVLLAMVTVHIDRTGDIDWATQVSWLSPAQPESARNILNVIAASMIAVASTVFSITIAAVAYASGSYGPRLLNNFMEDKGNQLSLATFVATFSYAVMVLRVVRDAGEDTNARAANLPGAYDGFVPQLSVLVATAMMAVAIAVLVYFLHHIPASIRINTVLEGIGSRLIRGVEERFPEKGDDPNVPPWPPGANVVARTSGYIQLIDYGALDRIARDHACRIVVRRRTGDFVQPSVPLLQVIDRKPDADLINDLLECYSWGGMRTADQDLEFLIDELVEIALRALSPGINDPFTALTATYWLSAATGEIAARRLDNGPDAEDYDPCLIRPYADDFSHYLRRGLGSVRFSAASSPIVADQFFDCLKAIAGNACNTERRRLVRDEGGALVAQARTLLTGPALDEVEQSYARFECDMRDRVAGGEA